ncbi:OmpA family protein [Oceanimonas sp. NS1]|nr:OmpA family protein [Oceanimonas sp. NS1]
MQPQFWPVIRLIGDLVKNVPGEILVSGHSDDINSGHELFSSNWELSTQRALAVADQLRRTQGFDDARMIVMGLADTKPLVANDSAENRRRNRRVEITISQGKPVYTEPLEAVPPGTP